VLGDAQTAVGEVEQALALAEVSRLKGDTAGAEALYREELERYPDHGKARFNVAQTLRVCDRALIINDGRVFKEGTPREIINDDSVRAAYLGNTFRGDEFDHDGPGGANGKRLNGTAAAGAGTAAASSHSSVT